MDDNSEAHMETDVSSTTDDVPETQEVTGSRGDVEMVVIVEEVKEEQDRAIDTKDELFQSPRTSNASLSIEPSPQKEPTPQKLVNISPVKENNVSKSLLLSPMKYEAQKIINKNSPVSVNDKSSPVKKQEPESSDSSAKVEIKPAIAVEKPIDRGPIKFSQVRKVLQKSPFKGIKLVSKSPIKLKRMQVKSTNHGVNIHEKSLVQYVQEIPNKEVNMQKISNKEVKLQQTSSSTAVKLQENINNQAVMQDKSENIGVSLHEKSSKGTPNVLEKSLTKEKSLEPTPITEVKMVENSSTELDLEDKPKTEDKLQNSTTTAKLDASASDSCNANTKVPSHDSGNTDNEITQTADSDKTDTVTLPAETIPNNVLLKDSHNSSDVIEKEHNKSISRELKSLINSAKESKIISECTQLTSKTRKSRSQIDTSNISLNASLEVDKAEKTRRGSTNSQVSNSSEKSDRSAMKRSMRSQNPEFVSKCKQFLHSVTAKVMKDSDEGILGDEINTNSKEKSEAQSENTDSSQTSPKKKKGSDQPILDEDRMVNKIRFDAYCWRCHWVVEQEDNDKSHPPMRCTVCPRSYHYKCLSTSERKTSLEKSWVCPDCLLVLLAEGSDTRSPAMKKTSLGMLCDLLKYALERMMDLNGVEPFMHPVDRATFPDYDKYVAHPMDLTQMQKNIADGLYGSTEAFVADAQWILHNSIIFNTLQSKLTGGARALVRSCRAEMGEIEACPECYASAHARKPTWFTDVCTTPHILLWAKLKGFPYWPAKGMTINSSGLVDVRFFGAHDRAWVPAKDCFLFSEKDPNNFRNKRQDILDSMQEAEQHIRNISRKYGKFVYPPFKTQFDPSKLTEQLKMMIPSFEGEVKAQMKDKPTSSSPYTTKESRRSNSKSSKSSTNDGDGSDSEDIRLDTTRQDTRRQDNTRQNTSIAPLTETIKLDKDNGSDKSVKSNSPTVENFASRKRRRSNLEEAIMTVMETSTTDKKKRVDSTEQKKQIDSTEQKKGIESTDQKRKTDGTDQKKSEQEEPSSSKEEKAKLITKEAEIVESTSKKKTETPKGKSKDEEEPSSSTPADKESLRVTPIKLVALPRPNKQTPKMFAATKAPSKPSTPKEEDKTPQKTKTTRSDKPSTSEKVKEEKAKAQKRRNSKTNKSQSNTSTPKAGKSIERKTEHNNEATSSKELRPRESKKKESDGEAHKPTAANSLLRPINTSNKDLQCDDDTTLAVLARERKHPGMPTISNVCSLSTTAGSAITPKAKQSIEITVEASSDSSIFTPTSTENVRNMREAVSKLQKLREAAEPVVGRVGVRAFARMTSPSRADDVEVEIKAEPVDLEEADADRHSEKMDLMNACKLRPVTVPVTLRDVRIHRVMPGGPRRGATRARARKTFPAPRRADEGRSELNGKDSMVYIPIQPPATQPPRARASAPSTRPVAPLPAGNNSTVNTAVSPLKPNTSLSSPSSSTATGVNVATAGQMVVPTVGQVPTTVHTVPLMTSVNGQWMFSLQPVMSVGGVDNSASGMVNGVTDRGPASSVVTLSTAAQNSASAPSTPAQLNRTPNDANTPKELPRLQQRPALQNPLDATGEPGPPPPPSAAGPLTAKLNQNAVKLADFFRTLLEDSIEKLDEPVASASALCLQLEQTRWRHAQEIEELKHNHELTLAEMRLSFEKDKLRLMSEARRTAQVELEAAVRSAKSKQWYEPTCANCTQEAQFYCCWNTAYCDYPCQRAHWPQHFAHHAKDGIDDETSTSDSRLQPQPENLPKSAPPQTPALTVGGKIAASRVYTATQDPSAQKASIIVSMVEDNSGNQTMKCVGTYKPAQGGQNQISPLIINKQVMNEEGAKKVVTSGGYLIVGAGGGSSSVITPAPSRRPHTIQYFS